jgi:hypothetical protein
MPHVLLFGASFLAVFADRSPDMDPPRVADGDGRCLGR